MARGACQARAAVPESVPRACERRLILASGRVVLRKGISSRAESTREICRRVSLASPAGQIACDPHTRFSLHFSILNRTFVTRKSVDDSHRDADTPRQRMRPHPFFEALAGEPHANPQQATSSHFTPEFQESVCPRFSGGNGRPVRHPWRACATAEAPNPAGRRPQSAWRPPTHRRRLQRRPVEDRLCRMTDEPCSTNGKRHLRQIQKRPLSLCSTGLACRRACGYRSDPTNHELPFHAAA